MKCGSKNVDVRNIGFVKCEWIYKGIMKQKRDSTVSGDGKTNDKKFHTFKEINLFSVFETLMIFVKETKCMYETNLSVVESEESDHIITEKIPKEELNIDNEKNNQDINFDQIEYKVENSIDEFDQETVKRRETNLGQVKKVNMLNNLLSDPLQHSSFKTILSVNSKEEKKENSKCNIY